MLDLKEQLKKNLAKFKISNLSFSQLALQYVETYLEKKCNIQGYMRNGILFIKPDPLEYKTVIFLKKAEIILFVNKKLESYGLENKVKDIIIK